MKKICLFLLFVSTMLSCSVVEKRNDKWPAPDIFANFKGGQSEDADTKTTLEFDPTTGTSHVYWCPGDELNVFFDTKSVKYQSTNTENSRSAVLRTEESVSEEEFLSTNLWGLYPYDEDAVCDGSSIVTSLSNSQSGVPNSFDDDLALMVAKSSDRNMFFMNVCGGLKFSLTRDDIKSITFRGNNEENLSGQLKIQIEDGQPVVTCKDGDKSVTLTPKEGDTFEKDVDYILMTLPANLEKGFTMSFDLDNARGELVYEKAVTLPRGDLGVKSSIDALATFEYDVTGISLDKTSASMKVGESIQLVATILPENATDKNVIWRSSDESVATVTDGNVTAVSLGSCTIMATSGEFSAACEIMVVPTLVTSVTLDKTTAMLRAGETVTLTATVNPEDATDKTVEWSTSDASVATVENGVVTAVKVGSATITAKAGDKIATCEIAVVPTPVTSVTLDKTSASLKAGETVTLTATVNPSDATDKTVTWSTSDASVATVENGVVTALEVGTATITAKACDKTAICAITVDAIPVSGVIIDPSSLEMEEGGEYVLTATIAPANATNKNVVWSSSNPGVATVDSNGKVTAVGGGDSIVTVTTSDGGKTATCSVSVTVPVNGVSLDKSSLEMAEGDEYGLTATVTPDDATNKNVTWSSDNTSVVTVSQNGGIRALKSGTATITVKTEDGNHTASCTVTVKQKVISVVWIFLNTSSLYMKKGDSESLIVTINPANATNKEVVWSSSNPEVATVDSNGKVTAVGGGDAIVTVTTIDGGLQAQCIIIVEVPVLGISLNRNSIDIGEGEEFMLEATITPEDATYKSVTWSTDNYFVATVDQNGCVRALNTGTATITVKTEDGDYTAICIVNVKYIPISSIVFEKSKYELNVGEVIKVKATVLPANASDKTLEWFVGDATKASISDDGEVKALSPGKTRLYARSLDEKVVASCEIVIKGDGMDPSIGDWGNGEGGEGIAD